MKKQRRPPIQAAFTNKQLDTIGESINHIVSHSRIWNKLFTGVDKLSTLGVDKLSTGVHKLSTWVLISYPQMFISIVILLEQFQLSCVLFKPRDCSSMIVWVNLPCIQVQSMIVGSNGNGTTAKMGIKNLHIGFFELVEYP